jgi:hypothetical protein
MIRIHYIVICSLFILGSCNYKTIKDPAAYNSQRGIDLNKPISGELKIGYMAIKENVLKVCLSCHVGKNQPDFGSAEQIKQSVYAISNQITLNNMPPRSAGYNPLSDCQKAMLAVWIKQGAPEISNISVNEIAECKDPSDKKNNQEELPIELLPITYTNLLERILKPRCITCHNAQNTTEASGVLFYPVGEILKERISWKAPALSSKVIAKLTASDEFRMPPPESGLPLSEAEVKFIMNWIDLGKPE